MPPTIMCVGAQKGGTQWLFDQLCGHPEVWMPSFKEVRFFRPPGRRVGGGRGLVVAERQLGWMIKHHAKGRPMRRSQLEQLPPLDESHIEFLRRYVAAKARDVPTYLRLFEPAGDRPSGDVTPGYARLADELIAELAEALPETRVVFTVREPVSRLWAQAQMSVRLQRTDDFFIIADERSLRRYLDHPAVDELSRQSLAIEKWSAAFGDRFRAFVMDDLVADADAFRADVFGFLGLDPSKCLLDARFNRKVKQEKVPIPPELHELLCEHFAGERERLAQLLGGRAESWVSSAPTE